MDSRNATGARQATATGRRRGPYAKERDRGE